MTADPPRLRDDPAGPELAEALRKAQGDVLSPEAVARVRTALQASGITALGAASAGGLGAAPPSLSLGARLLGAAVRFRIGLAALGLAVGIAGASSRWRPSSPEGAPSAPPDQQTAPASPAAVDPGAAAPPAEVSAPPGERPETPVDAPSATAAGTAHARGSARTAGAGAAPSPREGALLLEARRALGADPARALALVHAHEQEFPQSQLGPERTRIAAEARRRLEP